VRSLSLSRWLFRVTLGDDLEQLAALPLVVLLRGAWWQRGLWIGLVISALVGWEPLLTNTVWPLTLRMVHAMEITADSFAHGLVIAAYWP
jgi:hypothetical protein